MGRKSSHFPYSPSSAWRLLWAKKSHLGLSSIGSSPLREVPDPAWVLHIPFRGPYSVTELLRVHPRSASPGLFPTMALPFCFSKCISSYFSSNKSFLCILPCSHLLFCVLTCILTHLLLLYLLCFVIHLFLGLLCATATAFSHCFHPNVSKQRCLMTLAQVLVADRLLPSTAQPPGAICDWHQNHLCYLAKPCQLCPIQRFTFHSPE